MGTLDKKRVLVGVTGGIAAYKSPDLVRRLRERGAEVRVAITANATRFISALTLQAVSGHPVRERLLDADAESGMDHIELARWADLVVVAPASANFIARLAHGFADDLLSTVCLATRAKIAVAPAMNQQMWANGATRRNVSALAEQGVAVLGPASGEQACGEVGPGRLLEPEELAARVEALLGTDALAGLTVLVTAGPTWEAIDPVRGLSNMSSGKMGYAVAAAALAAGAAVTLVTGPTALAAPPGARTVPVISAADMHAAVQANLSGTDIFIAVAAVADYRPAESRDTKIKREAETLTLKLVKNPDVLGSVAAGENPPYTVGFAAETSDVSANARKKLLHKGIDLIAANRVGPGIGIAMDTNALTLIDRNGVTELACAPKSVLARELVAEIGNRFRAQSSAKSTRRAARH